MFRGTVGIMVVALALLSACVAIAQDGVNIVVAGDIVARVREKGSYDSIQARADAVHQAITEAMVGQDPATVEVSLKQEDGLWTVYIAGRPIIQVLPSEADANGMAPLTLGTVWVDSLRAALPDYTRPVGSTVVTVTDLGNPLDDEPVTAPAPGTTTTTTTGGTTETIEIPTTGGTATQPPTVAAAQGARLLIIDAFNKVRGMGEDEYVRARQGRASELLDDLLRVISGGEHGLPEEPVLGEADTGTGPGTTGPATSGVEEIPVGPGTSGVTTVDVGTTPTPTTGTTGGSTITGTASSVEEIHEGVPEDDPSYSRVPQKRRITKKFEAAQQPYLQLKTTNPDRADEVNELLKVARREFAAQNFDVAEEYLDGALRMLGVTQW